MPGSTRSANDDGHGERFELRGKLGAGGLGVVYRAFDRRRGVEVALKTLRKVTGGNLYRFKREFRTLADVSHPNLVTLHELHTQGGEWFLTMELIDGVTFIDWVRPRPPEADEPHEPTGDAPGRGVDLFGATGPTAAAAPPWMVTARQKIILAEPHRERLDAAIYQLADTVHALHLAGKLHRDLKPSNVLVEPSGRVVVLDFGLVADLNPAEADLTHETSAVGTPAYMSPEQAADRPLSPASDWYSVGVMLYEALTGRRPVDIVGPHSARSSPRLPEPRRFAVQTPAYLDELCMRLLHADPAARPDGAAVLAALGKQPSLASRELARSLASVPFVGRAAELDTLRQAMADVQAGACVAVFVRAASGMGKSSLLRHFLDEAASSGQRTIVLKGRCYERESVPFKTLDAVVDSLATHLVQQPVAELQKLLPRDIAALARLFPVLLRVPGLSEPALRSLLPPDPLELRRRGFGALRELLARLGARQPLVVAIDDVQWGDADSGTFFAELLHHPDAPAMLLVACHRSEDEDVTPLLAALRRSRAVLGGGPERVSMREISLGPLGDAEARRLVASVHAAGTGGGAGQDDSGTWVGQVVRESGGSPMFLAELARRSDDSGEHGLDVLSLEQVLIARIDRLSADARALLAVCAAAGRPLHSHTALRAAGLGGEGSLVASLSSERLLRVRHPSEDVTELETYHDRIRATVMSRLSGDERRRLHAALAAALVAAAELDHEALVGHLLEAGELARAAHHAEQAAAAAEERVAFHRAAELYAVALSHGGHDELARRALRTRLANSLAHAGHLDDAAAQFALAALGAPAAEKLELERLELEQLLRAGRLDLGLDKSRAVLAAVGHRLPTSQVGAIASFLAQRLLLRLRGFDFDLEHAPATPPSPAELQRTDVLWSVSSGLGFVNPIFGQVLQMRYLRQALGSRHPHHVGLAFCLELGYLGLSGMKHRKQLERLREQALAIGVRTGDRELVGVAKASGGLASFLSGRWRECAERLYDAERVLRDECTRVRWQLDLLEAFLVSTLWYLGEVRELVRRVPMYLHAAEERGDAYAMRGLRGWRGNNLWIALDQPDEARAQVEAVALPRAAEQPAQLTHYYELMAHTQIDLYKGDAAAAHARVEGFWRALERARLQRIQNLNIEAWYLRARAALGLIVQTDPGVSGAASRPALTKLAQTAARRIAEQRTTWGAPFAALVRATLAHTGRDLDRAEAELRTALGGFEAADMALYASATRARLGALLGGAQGAGLVEQAEAFMRAQAIVNPTAMVRMLVPGW